MEEEIWKQLKRFEKQLDNLIKKELCDLPIEDVKYFFQDISVEAYLMLVLEEE